MEYLLISKQLKKYYLFVLMLCNPIIIEMNGMMLKIVKKDVLLANEVVQLLELKMFCDRSSTTF